MSQIEELQGRISAAMDRIGAGVEALMARPAASAAAPADDDGHGDGDAAEGAPAGPAADVPEGADLAALLEDERIANAQLQERLKAVKAKCAAEIEALKAAAAESGRVAALEAEIATLRGDLEAARSEGDSLRAELETAAALGREAEALRRETESQAEAMTRLDREVQRVREVNARLREVVAALREAAAAGVSDAHLINKAMLAELEALRATQAADAAEAGAILARLDAVLSNAADLPEGEEE